MPPACWWPVLCLPLPALRIFWTVTLPASITWLPTLVNSWTPLADKCLTTAAFIYMVADGICSPVVLAIILFREFAVAGVRMIAAESGTVIAANMWGKVKTVLQMLTIIFYYFAAALSGPTDVMGVGLITVVLTWLVAAATLLSGGIYLWQNRSCFMQAK